MVSSYCSLVSFSCRYFFGFLVFSVRLRSLVGFCRQYRSLTLVLDRRGIGGLPLFKYRGMAVVVGSDHYSH